MTKKCSVCKGHEAVYAWQPDLDKLRENFYVLGYHIRGFMVVPVCQDCCDQIKAGKNVSFKYRGLDWWTQGASLVNSSMCVYH